LLAVARLDGAGKVAGTVALKSDGGRQAAKAAATAENLRFPSAPDAPVIGIGRATVNLAAKDLLKGDGNVLELRLEKGAVGDLSLTTLTGHAAGSLDRLKLSLQAKGDWRGPLTLDAAANYAGEKSTPSLAVSKLQGTVVGRKLTLRDTMRLNWGGGRYEATPINLTYGEAKLSGHAQSGQKGVDVAIKLDDVPLATVDPFWPLGIKGDVDATLAVKGAWPNPPGSFRVTAPGLKVDQAPDTPALSVDIGGDWKQGRLAVDGKLKAGDAAPSVITASLPLRLDGPALSVTVPPDERVSGRLDWSGETAALWRFSPLTEHLLRGDGKIDVTLSGTVAKPDMNGSLTLNDGYYESLEYGTVLKPLNLTVRFDGRRARITRLDAGDGSGGKVDGKGAVTFDAAAGFPFNLALKLDALTAVRRDDVQATATGDISIDGSMEKMTLESKLTTDRVEIRIMDRLPPDVATLDVVEIGRLGKVEKKEEKPNPLAANIALAIDVAMPRRVFVRGRGIESEWKGNLKVTGQADAPRIAGYIALVRGQIAVVGKTFKMESGNVVLPERADAEPNMSLVAAYAGQNLTVRAHVDGPISKPSITLSSVPSLPQDEIVSQVLFNKSSSRLSAFEAAQLALALAELAGKGGSGGILDFARKTLGVDVLQVESVETSDGAQPVVGAGKYLTDDVYVGVKQGASPESSSVGVEVEVTPNIFLESDVRRSGESDVGVKFKYDY
jgi:translocation and assembly module TamB